MRIKAAKQMLLCYLLCLTLPVAVAEAAVSTTFDTDLEGWLVTGDNASTWESDTGNPGGCLSVNDLATGDLNLVIAPPSYHGDWSLMDQSDSLSIDIYMDSGDPDDYPQDFIFRIQGPGGAAFALSGTEHFPVRGVWNHYSVAIDETSWTLESGNWGDLLSGVFSLQVWGEFISGSETVRIDNVLLDETPVEAFFECLADDFNTPGTGEWSFTGTGSVTNPGSGGNGGGYLKIGEGSGTESTAYVPAMFLGDMSQLDGTGYITLDLRIISHSGTNLGSPEFIRLAGPGGSAHVSLTPEDLPQNARVWRTYRFPLDASIWTIDGGTWSGLLADVTECRLDLEYFDSTESIGLDNFGRLQGNCDPIDDPLVLHDPDLNPCGHYSFVNIYSVAINPLDELLYGLISASPSGGGGLYEAKGDHAGDLVQAMDEPDHLVFDEDGTAFVTVDTDGVVYKVPRGEEEIIWIEEFHSGDDDPLGIGFAPSGFVGTNIGEGDILVLDWGYSGADEIYSFAPEIQFSEQLVTPDPGTANWLDLAGASADTVYIVDTAEDDAIMVLNPEGIMSPMPLVTPIPDMFSIVYDSDLDRLYVASDSDEAVYRVTPVTGAVELVADGFDDLSKVCLEIDVAKRRLYVVDQGYDRIYEICLPHATAVEDTPPAATGGQRLSAYPNPFNPQTNLVLSLVGRATVRLAIHDVAGREIRSWPERVYGAGSHTVTWDGRDGSGEELSSGVYFARMTTADRSEAVKLLLLK